MINLMSRMMSRVGPVMHIRGLSSESSGWLGLELLGPRGSGAASRRAEWTTEMLRCRDPGILTNPMHSPSKLEQSG
jgi:hypothetical protein